MDKLIYLVPYLLSLGLSLGILYISWRNRRIRGATLFFSYMLAQSISSFGFLMEMVNPSVNGKILWDAIQWIAMMGALLAIPPFAVAYAEYDLKKPGLVWALSFIVPGLFVLALLMEKWSHLIYANTSLISSLPYSELHYDLTWVLYSIGIYGALVILLCIGLLFRRILIPRNTFKSQIIIIIIGIFIPLLGIILNLAGIQFTPQRDSRPFMFALGNLIIALGLFRFRLFDFMPVAREVVFENISDGVFVFDNLDRLVDINSSALGLLGTSLKKIIGAPVENVMDHWPEVITQLRECDAKHQKGEFMVGTPRGQIQIEADIDPILDRRKRLVGHVIVVRDITQRKLLEKILVDMAQDLEKRVQERTKELADAYDITLEGWARTLELRDKETEGHSRTVTEMALHLAILMKIPQEELVHIRRGALLHDIGKMGIPDEILKKPSSLTEEERQVINTHPELAFKMLAPISFLHKAMEIPYYHHEKWDGTGYPFGLKGNKIPLSARIFAIVDVYDAMCSERPYHGPMSKEKVIEYIKKQSGHHFDPKVVKAFMNLYEKGWA